MILNGTGIELEVSLTAGTERFNFFSIVDTMQSIQCLCLLWIPLQQAGLQAYRVYAYPEKVDKLVFVKRNLPSGVL